MSFGLTQLADIRITELLTASLGSRERFPGALCDPLALFLGYSSVDMQHEWLYVRP